MFVLFLRTPTRAWRPSIGDVLGAALRLVLTWNRRYIGRRELRALGDDQLRDIGISRHQAKQEAAKPFWRG